MSFSVFRATSENTDDKVLQVSEELFTLHRKSVCVYCASSTQIDEKYFRAAEELGSLIAQNGLRLITGAGKLGLMNTIQDAALAAGGEAVGVIPTFMVNEGWHHEGLTQLIETASMHERKQTMADLVTKYGGKLPETMEELLEIITWKQLGLYLNPIVILNIDGYYDALLAQLATAVEENFMRSIHADIWSVATTPKEAIELLLNTPKWDKNIRKFAAI